MDNLRSNHSVCISKANQAINNRPENVSVLIGLIVNYPSGNWGNEVILKHDEDGFIPLTEGLFRFVSSHLLAVL